MRHAYPERDVQEICNPDSPNRKQILASNMDTISLVSEFQARRIVDAHDGVPSVIYVSEIALLCRRLSDVAVASVIRISKPLSAFLRGR